MHPMISHHSRTLASLFVVSVFLVRPALAVDCNANGVSDDQDVANCAGAAWCDDCNRNSVPDVCDIPHQGLGFTNPASWATYDPGANGVGTDPDGFYHGAFDGRYAYFSPVEHDGNVTGGEILRYDTYGGFASTDSWHTYDPGPSRAYSGAVYDHVHGFVYFVPVQQGTQAGKEVLRYNTALDFSDPAAWERYAVDAAGGYFLGVFDDRFVYFVPGWNGQAGAAGVHGEVLRFDTNGAFDDAGSWETFDAGYDRGYWGAIFDGTYVYFVPHDRGADYFGEILRYNTNGGFADPSSWTAYDAGHGEGYCGGTFDGRYVYFLPQARNEPPNINQEVLRYDSLGSFTAPESWVSFYPGFGHGFNGAVYDGTRFVYLAGFVDGPGGIYGEQARLDTWGNFTDPSAWLAFDPGENGVGNDADGYRGTIFDGRYVYFVPWDNGAERHGEVLRYDTLGGVSLDCDSSGVPDECQLAAEDPDADLVIDPCDNCPADANPDQSDQDEDGWGDVCDNCPDVYNPGQENTNGIGLGDACECPSFGACDDANVCTHGKCVDPPACSNTPARFGDVNGSGGAPNLDDILCVLAAFGGNYACAGGLSNADPAPTGGPNACQGNGGVDLDDILAVLAAFAGADPCGCNQ